MLVVLTLLLLSCNFATSLVGPHFLAITEFVDRAHALSLEASGAFLDSPAVSSTGFAATGAMDSGYFNQVNDTLNELEEDSATYDGGTLDASAESNKTVHAEALEGLTPQPYRQIDPRGNFNLGPGDDRMFWNLQPHHAPFSDPRMRYSGGSQTFHPGSSQFGFSRPEHHESLHSSFPSLPEPQELTRRMMVSAARPRPFVQPPHRGRYLYPGQPRLPPGPLPPRPHSRGPARYRHPPFHPKVYPPSNLRPRHIPFRPQPPPHIQRHLGPGNRNAPFHGHPLAQFPPTSVVPRPPAKPLYSYPPDAMSIQDIIRYMDAPNEREPISARISPPNEDSAEVMGMRSNAPSRQQFTHSRRPPASRMNVHTDFWPLSAKFNNRDDHEEHYAHRYGLDMHEPRSGYEAASTSSGSSASNHKPKKVILHLNLYSKGPHTRQNSRHDDMKYSATEIHSAASSTHNDYPETDDYYHEDTQAAESKVSTDQDDLLVNHRLPENHGRSRSRDKLNTHFASRNNEPDRDLPYALWLTQEKTMDKKEDDSVSAS